MDHTHFKSIFIDRLNDFDKEHFGGECVTMIDDWLSFISIPTVQLHTAAAMIQRSKRKNLLFELSLWLNCPRFLLATSKDYNNIQRLAVKMHQGLIGIFYIFNEEFFSNAVFLSHVTPSVSPFQLSGAPPWGGAPHSLKTSVLKGGFHIRSDHNSWLLVYLL